MPEVLTLFLYNDSVRVFGGLYYYYSLFRNAFGVDHLSHTHTHKPLLFPAVGKIYNCSLNSTPFYNWMMLEGVVDQTRTLSAYHIKILCLRLIRVNSL